VVKNGRLGQRDVDHEDQRFLGEGGFLGGG
jgi:hypothetical protein